MHRRPKGLEVQSPTFGNIQRELTISGGALVKRPCTFQGHPGGVPSFTATLCPSWHME